MALNKAIQHGKEYRKPYKGAKAVCKSCRNHGGCPWCEGNRIHKEKSKDNIAKKEIKDFYK